MAGLALHVLSLLKKLMVSGSRPERERYRRDKTGELLSEIDPKPNNDNFT